MSQGDERGKSRQKCNIKLQALNQIKKETGSTKFVAFLKLTNS